MAWWRRDPSLWCRSPLHRYARRVLRDNEAVLRSRSFSKSQPATAQHKDDEDKKNPNGLPSIQWMQLQQYRRWRRRLQEDPYRVLFGASNDMLDGKGLKDWQWVYKAFPKWMIKEMDMFEDSDLSKPKNRPENETHDSNSNSKRKSPPHSSTSSSEVYPKRIRIREDESGNTSLGARKSELRNPSSRPAGLGQAGYNSQVVSPSDTRRPLEYKVLEEGNTVAAQKPAIVKEPLISPETNAFAEGTSRGNTESPKFTISSQEHLKKSDAKRRNQEAMSRESTFIREFLDNPPHKDEADWRQTVLDRRLAPEPHTLSPGPEVPQVPPTDISISWGKNNIVQPGANSAQQGHTSPGERFWPAMASRGQSVPPVKPAPSMTSSQSLENVETSSVNFNAPALEKPQCKSTDSEAAEKTSCDNLRSKASTANVIHLDGPSVQTSNVRNTKTTSEVLRQLPEDDLDFLSADEIRASMQAKRSSHESTQQRQKARSELEKQYERNHEESPELHPMIASKIVSDHHVRRAVKSLERYQTADQSSSDPETETISAEAKGHPEVSETPNSVPDASMETSLDRMTRWLQAGGVTFAKHFWSEPTLAKHAGLPSSQQHQAIVAGIRAGRNAMEQVEDSIEKVLPSSKPLLNRLQDNENTLLRSTRFMLGPRSVSGADEESFKFKSRTKNVRNDLRKTEEEFEEACKALKATKDKEILNSAKRGLQTASLVLQKNTKLTRRIVFRVQALEDNPAATQHKERFKEVKNRLSALQDTQVALLRLVDRAIQLFGPPVQPENVQTVANLKGLQGPIAITVPGLSADFEIPRTTSQMLKPESTRNEALNQKLDEEIASQKLSMRGLSDDGYQRAPKEPIKDTFNESNPLANSLFRPFKPLFESLGKEEYKPISNLDSQAAMDKTLVQEIKKSYEDVYGPITVSHRQIEQQDNDKPAEAEEDKVPVMKVSTSDKDVETSKPAQNAIAPSATEISSDIADDLNHREAKDSETSALSPEKDSWANRELNCQPEPAMTAVDMQPSVTSPDARSENRLKNLQQSKELQDPQSMAAVDSDVMPTSSDQASEVPLRVSEETLTRLEETPSTEHTYKILTYDPTTDEMHITTTTSKSMETSGKTIPVHEALAGLDAPAKFVPHISSLYVVVTSKPNLLVLRECSTPTEEILNSSVYCENEVRDEEWKRINPVDGTTRLSPTGFVGVEPELRDDHEAARRKFYEKWEAENERKGRPKEEKQRKGKRGGATASVFKTAIIASAGCYIAGVIGELLR